MVAKVIIDVKNNQLDRLFDYHVPDYLEQFIQVGSRVFVPFGKQKLMGFVIKLEEVSSFDKLKDIIELLDYEPILSEELIKLGNSLASNYFSFLVEEYKMMLPSALKVTYPKELIIHNFENLSDNLKLIVNGRNNVPLIQVEDYLKEISKLAKTNDVTISNIYKENSKPKTQRMVRLLEPLNAKTLKQKEIISYLSEVSHNVSVKTLINDMGYTQGVLNTLAKNQAIEIFDDEVYRSVAFNDIFEEKKVLNSIQQNVFDEIKSSFGKNQTFLIHGVCGSGKTEVYLHLIEEVLKTGKEALMLVPEISLTPQIVSRFKSRFGDDVAIIHSRLSSGEKFDEWRRIKRGQAKICVGARSALFVPMDNIGIIIMDEEQESSYIQDTNPKYDAHFVANFRAKYHNATLIYGSATPKITTYYSSLNEEIKLLEINKKANNQEVTSANIVDMREELKSGNKSVLSVELKKSIKETLLRNEQALLLINRRGYSTFVMCRSCGEEIKCPHCDVTLTYHKFNDSLICHYCGYQIPSPKKCPKCNSPYIRFVGDGTQKLEEELNNQFPEARVLRMDSDTTKNKDGHKDIISSFLNHDADILLGTQVVAKGLDFPLVSLVGIVNADLGLKMPFYDSYESTFDLIVQASGRAGRKDTNSKVIIQTYNPDNDVMKFSSKGDYKGFYESELRRRKMLNNPPFTEMIELIVSSEDMPKCKTEAYNIYELIKKQDLSAIVLGPTKYYIFKIKDRYHYQLILKLNKKVALDVLKYLNERFESIKDVYLSIKRM